LPTGVYGAFEGKNNEVYIATDRAALNMAYQHLLKEEKKVEKICEVVGQDLIGKAVKAPLTSYEKVYIWPMLSISMKKGTGIVTSVPSDSPDDYAVLADLVNKKAFREKFGLTDEQVLPFEPIPIINIPGYGDGLSAVLAYKEFKVAS
jgi:leucyl-tRNA synthetase